MNEFDLDKYSPLSGDGLTNINPNTGAVTSVPNDGLVDWNERTRQYDPPRDQFVQWDPKTGTYESPSQRVTAPAVESEVPTSYPATRGAAVSVINSLRNITFVPGTFGGMSGSIAYIRYWSRSGVQQKTSAGGTTQNGAPADTQAALASAVAGLSPGAGGFRVLETSTRTTPTRTTGAGGFRVLETSTRTTPTRTTLTVPTNTAYQSRPRQPVPTQTSAPRSQGGSFLSRLGSLFNANPGGPASSNIFYTPQAAADPVGAVWQFLFNPEELQLESGPDYNRAETWGVSDPANSGQPLSWRANKNRKLTFGKVILHGYTFGKRVDSLEAGLQRLFMARDGENGADGPPVLEFVWGRRVFGPCVIQNIRVREQSWDSGILVNAEVSFDLEQVPEWTINDGFVDVLRPGRQPTVNDPTLPGRTAGGERDPSELPPVPPSSPSNLPGGGNPTSPQPYDARKCQRAYYYAGLFKQFETKINEVNIFLSSREETRRISTDFIVRFQDATQELGQDFAPPEEATEIYKKIDDILNPNRPGGRLDGGQIKGYVNGYTTLAYRKAEAIFNNSTKCPNTAGKTVLQRQIQISSPTNL